VCSRYELLTKIESIIAGFAVREPLPDDFDNGPDPFTLSEIKPTNRAPVITPGGKLVLRPWGLKVDWQNQPVINARSETLDQKPTFKPLLARRCLVPATAYFEWRKAGRDKIKTRLRPQNNDLFAFAGLLNDEAFTIVTCTPTPAIAHIHDRMPVILPRAAQDLWLSDQPYSAVKSVLVSFGESMTFDELSPPKRQGELAL
jgi:putative SOS response-associated peptidase YedK